jgi:hypothetical protein
MPETSRWPAEQEHPHTSLLCGGLHHRSPLQPSRTAGFSPIHAAPRFGTTAKRAIANQMEFPSGRQPFRIPLAKRLAGSTISSCALNATHGVSRRSQTLEQLSDVCYAGTSSGHTARLQSPACDIQGGAITIVAACEVGPVKILCS